MTETTFLPSWRDTCPGAVPRGLFDLHAPPARCRLGNWERFMGLLGPSRQRDGYVEREGSSMSFEDQVRGYEDSPFVGTLVAMWRCAGLSHMTRGEALRVLGVVALSYATLWLAFLWAAL